MCPVVQVAKKNSKIDTIVCVTSQHRQMLDQVIDAFDIEVDYDFNIMKQGQDLFDITSAVLLKMRKILEEERPDVVLVHGDTTTSFATAMACFYCGIKIGHVEAGLRTYRLDAPFPEEFNRQATDLITEYYFAPTAMARDNLLREGKSSDKIHVTGNTVIDALKTTVQDDYTNPLLEWVGNDRLILMTAHRRESFGEPLHRMFRAVRKICEEIPNVKVVYPVHLNPIVRNAAQEELNNIEDVRLVEPMGVLDFHNMMAQSYLILTDSGGIQEEAPSLGKPVLVMRDITERPEGVEAGTLRLVGTDEDTIFTEAKALLTNETLYRKMSNATNPYGDGHASERIIDILING